MNDQPVQWPTTQSRDLLYCLLQHPLGLRKEEVGVLFWPDHPPHRLDGIFRSTLYRLRRALHRDVVLFDEGVYRFNRDCTYWYDVEAFEQLIEEAGRAPAPAADRKASLLGAALALYRDDYLEGIYADWCMLERERLRDQAQLAMEALAALFSARGNLAQAVELYQRLLALDPCQESIHQALMRCYWRLGDRAAAIRQYQACARVLRTELGLSPAAETEDLYLQIIA
jgi:DNA-binding SARP family transcriptional activator